LWLRRGVNPEDPEDLVLAVVVDPEGGPADRAVQQLWSHAYEGDGVFHLVRTDGWAEQSLNGDVLTVDAVVYPSVLSALGIDEAAFAERSPIEPQAVRLLRVSAAVDVAEYQRTPLLAVVLEAPAGTSAERMLTLIAEGEVSPLVLAPPPGHDPW
jgi:hypothetical protein